MRRPMPVVGYAFGKAAPKIRPWRGPLLLSNWKVCSSRTNGALSKAVFAPSAEALSFQGFKDTLKLHEGLRAHTVNSRERMLQGDNCQHHQRNRECETRTHYNLGCGIVDAEEKTERNRHSASAQ